MNNLSLKISKAPTLVGVLYCDFSGYSDIARGLCKLMGFDLMINFKLPYFARNPRDFWSRWHISLSSWLRDYLYFPLGGNKRSKLNTYRNLFLTMLLGGLWHGAAWSYVLWGAFHGIILSLYRVSGKDKEDVNSTSRIDIRPGTLCGILAMFILTIIGWLIFRSTSLTQIGYMLTHISPSVSGHTLALGRDLVFFTMPLIAMQAVQYFKNDLLIVTKLNPWMRIPVYCFLVTGLLIFGSHQSVEFIYFQF